MKRSRSLHPSANSEPLRFAHPFFLTTLPEQRPASKTEFGSRMLDHIQGRIEPIPLPRGTPSIQLSSLIGATGTAEIQAAGTLFFHTVGDTGLPAQPSETPQEMVAAAMTADYDISRPAQSPAFLFHLGDVVYGPQKDQSYRGQFYEPYKLYPGKIIAIPGNHDGETFAGTDPVTLRAFLANFCTAAPVVPPIAGTIFRQTMTEPGAYWVLDAPFLQIIGLYSNTAENPGFISGPIPGPAQKTWLVSTLKNIASIRATGARKALAIATHHPPFSSGGHAGSATMLADIDDACQQAGIFPDIFFSGHSHSYQRYTRFVTNKTQSLEIPYLVVGCGGHGDQPVNAASGQRTGDHRFDASYRGYGYALVAVTQTTLKVQFFAVSHDVKTLTDTVVLDLTSNKLSKTSARSRAFAQKRRRN